ncbi:TonB-dependent receptor [Flavobacterium sp.]|uniref:TonB-dependent receptor n=1 Tax=Flavobacterium sp. TaxID=239 RepID=UPI0035273E37
MKFLFKTKCIAVSCLLAQSFYAQEKENDSLKVTQLEELVINSVRAKAKNPITFTNVSQKQIEERNLGQDIPVLLNYLPSVVTTTDAGNGVGYTYMRVRGSDGSRINVTLNGVPFNDSESQGTFFVNLPDFASSLQSVQLQRGVGTSTNGAGAFGASLNMQTKPYQEEAHAEIATAIGSFNTQKHTLSFGTGLHNNFEINGRLSKINSDGYIDRASSNMLGYLFNVNYVKESTLINLIAFGGKEKTYQAWNGLEDLEKLKNDRTYNSAGLYYDENGNEQFYDDETDNYWQNHFQLHWSEEWNNYWKSNLALHYTKGKGYFEQYKEDENLTDYYLPAYNGNSVSDLVRKRWLNNDFFGTTFSINYKKDKTDIIFGGAANRYLGLHYGEVIWTPFYIPNTNRYYDNFGNKDDVNFYAKASQQFNKLNVFADFQYRMVFYEATSTKFNAVNDTFRFFNPKIGLNYELNAKNSFYGFAGIANKEPRRDDYENDANKPERLYDFEAGWKLNSKKIRLTANTFYMLYKNQLVLTGALNDVGSPIFTNSGKSYRIGLEIESAIQFSQKIILQANVTLSQNKNIDFYFQRNGELQNLGNTNSAYSPNLVGATALNFLPIKDLQLTLLGKYVSKQYMGNINSENSILNAYGTLDFNANYIWNINKGVKSIVFSALVNNILNLEYESNGYFYTYDDDWTNPNQVTTVEGVGYYPQAGINFLAGVTIKF